MDICPELEQNFIDYAYEVNLNRAFPDARDGLKVGARLSLWEMYRSGYTSDKPHVKSAKVSGSVVAFFHPHNPDSVYETFGRMSQDYLCNAPCTDFHGNNGNISIGPELCSSRYSEIRLSKISEEGLLKGINKRNVPFVLNFSEDMEMPSILPAILPNLFVNGAIGTGVSIATNILPHNLKEVSSAIVHYIKTGEIDTSHFYPDFPSGGIIVNKDELESIYTTGKGKVILRSKAEIKKNKILITELPYQVYVEPIKEKIIELVENGKLKGIADVLNKTDKNGLLVEIEVERGFNPEQVLESLFNLTDLQKTFNANQMALVGKTPKLLTLKEYFDIYITHNLECLEREHMFDLNKAKERKEIVEGLVKALESIDDIIALIKTSDSTSKAKENLIFKYNFTERQAQSIVDMKLGKLAKLESVELNKELEGLIETINSINTFLSSPEAQKEVVISNLENFTKKYGKPRRTTLVQLDLSKKKKDSIIEEDIYIALTDKNKLARKPNAKKNSKIKFVTEIKTTESLYLFTQKGEVHIIPANKISSTEESVYSLLSLEDGEEIVGMGAIREGQFVICITENGRIKKTKGTEYTSLSRKKSSAIKLKEEDKLVIGKIVNPEESFRIETNEGRKTIKEASYLPKGRATIGNKLSGKGTFKVIGEI